MRLATLKKNAKLILRKYVSAMVIIYSCIILASVFDYGVGFSNNMIIGGFVGTTSFIFATIALFTMNTRSPFIQMTGSLVSVASGAALGFVIGTAAAGKDIWSFIPEKQDLVLQVIIVTVLGGTLFRFILDTQHKIARANEKIQAEKIKRLTTEKKIIETNLKLLQAQIEPHFLFNTLSNILSLIDTDLDKGREMMEDLIAYLRITLSKTRGDMVSISMEMMMIRAYLNIFKIRMGDRLNYKINVPENLKHVSFPPMLIQPLVENAIQHGLEPRIEGGEITIEARHHDKNLQIEVADSGLGFHPGSGWGVGLTNIKERIESLYENKGRLIFEENTPNGLKVTIEVPYENS